MNVEHRSLGIPTHQLKSPIEHLDGTIMPSFIGTDFQDADIFTKHVVGAKRKQFTATAASTVFPSLRLLLRGLLMIPLRTLALHSLAAFVSVTRQIVHVAYTIWRVCFSRIMILWTLVKFNDRSYAKNEATLTRSVSVPRSSLLYASSFESASHKPVWWLNTVALLWSLPHIIISTAYVTCSTSRTYAVFMLSAICYQGCKSPHDW